MRAGSRAGRQIAVVIGGSNNNMVIDGDSIECFFG